MTNMRFFLLQYGEAACSNGEQRRQTGVAVMIQGEPPRDYFQLPTVLIWNHRAAYWSACWDDREGGADAGVWFVAGVMDKPNIGTSLY